MPAQLVPVIQSMVASGIQVGDLLADSGYAHRVPATWALPLRALRIDLAQDLHASDRGPHGTHQGAISSNGNLYCGVTLATLLELQPLHPAASSEQTATHNQQCQELATYKLSPISAYDKDGYRRVKCPPPKAKSAAPTGPPR